MRGRTTLSFGLAWLWLLSLACTPGKSVEPDTGSHAEAGDGRIEADRGADDHDEQGTRGSSDDAKAQRKADACVAGQLCSQYGQSCVVGRTHCHCTHPCSGVELLPEENRPRWACREVDPACPEAIPEQGERCRPNGLRCGWGTCGGASATCEERRWKVIHYGPPP